MDTRTKQKHLRAVRLLMHALEGHRSSLPLGKTVNTVVAEGMAAAHILGIDLIAGEARAIAGRAVVVGRGVEALYSGPAIQQACGIERSCPRGDA
ncbi:hypothetical protein [uncultured Desulfovibrio sp.]|uniref:hypothetical protein n=1 Tax=uncultured Desulfovibrio sp. TaxID=167968 RepID=UPI00260C1468|nr:hypothetical protein [uncultured Desulfovibrio sp.]